MGDKDLLSVDPNGRPRGEGGGTARVGAKATGGERADGRAKVRLFGNRELCLVGEAAATRAARQRGGAESFSEA